MQPPQSRHPPCASCGFQPARIQFPQIRLNLPPVDLPKIALLRMKVIRIICQISRVCSARVLCGSALSGVQVTLIVPARNDSRIVAGASRSFYQALLHAGVEIYEYDRTEFNLDLTRRF